MAKKEPLTLISNVRPNFMMLCYRIDSCKTKVYSSAIPLVWLEYAIQYKLDIVLSFKEYY